MSKMIKSITACFNCESFPISSSLKHSCWFGILIFRLLRVSLVMVSVRRVSMIGISTFFKFISNRLSRNSMALTLKSDLLLFIFLYTVSISSGGYFNSSNLKIRSRLSSSPCSRRSISFFLASETSRVSLERGALFCPETRVC